MDHYSCRTQPDQTVCFNSICMFGLSGSGPREEILPGTGRTAAYWLEFRKSTFHQWLRISAKTVVQIEDANHQVADVKQRFHVRLGGFYRLVLVDLEGQLLATTNFSRNVPGEQLCYPPCDRPSEYYYLRLRVMPPNRCSKRP